MYGNIILDLFFIKSYNFGFLFTDSDIIINLINWQYWWWFWFSFIIAFYYLLIIKCLSTRNLKFFPKIVTSQKSHGKWGDVIVCLLPVSWCLNILSNSTLLLKILEWQSEASYTTIRVRGKQWYWVYKIDFKSIFNSINSNLYNLKLGSYSTTHNKNYTKNNIIFNNIIKYVYTNKNISKLNIRHTDSLKINNFYNNLLNLYNAKLNKNTIQNAEKINNIYSKNKIYNLFLQLSNIELLDKRKISKHIISLTTVNKLNIKTSLYRDVTYNNFLLIKQKSIVDQSKFLKNNILLTFVEQNIENNNYESTNYIINNRLLKVNNLLVVPINTFLNIITNSYDVIHSWFIPGLGIKMDCVPGRSTHHTLFINTPGIYYGQCAEICGRLHHHMPIKICAITTDLYYIYITHTLNIQNIFNKKQAYL